MSSRKKLNPTFHASWTNIQAPPFGDDPRRACRNMPTDVFYPPRYTENNISLVVAVCNTCVLKAVCAEWATVQGEPEGVWGGTTPDERRVERDRRRRATA